MQERGQVTVFIVVGIVLLFVFAGIFFVVSYMQTGTLRGEEETPLALSIKPQLVSFVESCLKETAEPGIYLLGMQGGVIYPYEPEKVLLTEEALINYGYLNGVNQLDREKMEEQLSRFVEENIHLCLDFSGFAERGIFVEEKKPPKVQSRISPEAIAIELKQKLEATSGGDTLRIDSFSAEIELPLGKLREQALEIIDAHGGELPVPDGSFLTIFPFDASTTIYSLSDESSETVEQPIVFMFAVQKEANTPPQLDIIPNQVIQTGERFTYQLTASDAEDDLLRFSSDSALFPVTEDGVIEAAPVEIGVFAVTFTVEDTSGEKDGKEVRFVVQ